jgi:uncharacterized protein (TIGR02147 family)
MVFNRPSYIKEIGMGQRANKIRVFDYTDYRKYLLDYYKTQKKSQSAFSYRFFANKAGFNSVGLYKDVIEGRQSLGRALTVKFSKALGHSKREAEYFENMVFFNEARSVDDRKLFFERMLACCDIKTVLVDTSRCEYYSKWYYSALRALLSYVRFKDDYAKLAEMLDPSIKPAESRKAIETLERLGFIGKDEKGFYRLTEALVSSGRLTTDASVQTMNVIGFQREMTHLGKEAYDRFPTDRLDMSSLTLSVSEATFKEMKEEISALRRKLLLKAEQDQAPDRVYQLNYQFFPLTKIDRKVQS